MSRIDESSLLIVKALVVLYGDIMSQEHLKDAEDTLKAIRDGSYDDDPGNYGPVDLCKGCAKTLEEHLNEQGLWLDDGAAHPFYDDYHCYVCGRRLWEDIDG